MSSESNFESVVVLDAAGNIMKFTPEHEVELNPETGRLYVSINGHDVAVYADRGWLMYGRPSPAPEAEEPTEADDFDEDGEYQ